MTHPDAGDAAGRSIGVHRFATSVRGRPGPQYHQPRWQAPNPAGAAFGANSWLVEEMYEQFRADPDSVSESWREFFADYQTASRPPAAPRCRRPPAPPRVAGRRRRRRCPRRSRAAAPAAAVAAPAPAAARWPRWASRSAAPASAIAANMERSLTVPTATSFRNVPAKLLEVNRKVINGYRSRTGQGKVSFTHLIGYAIVRAIADAVPDMNNTLRRGRRRQAAHRAQRPRQHGPRRRRRQGRRQSRTLVVPVLRDADTLDFAGFLAAYEDLIRKVKTNKLAVADFQGATHHAHQPGHHRHRAVGAAAHARPGRHRRRRHHRLPGRVPGRRRAHARRARRSARSSRSPAPTTTASSRAPRAACS